MYRREAVSKAKIVSRSARFWVTIIEWAAKQGSENMKPTVKLTGNDGNAFVILGSCHLAGKKAGWNKEKLKEFSDKATSGDYNHLLRTACEYFDVQLP
jgi:hypothetical protein